MKFTGELGSTRKKSNPTRSDLGSNWGLNTEKPRTERLSNGRDLSFSASSSQKSFSCVISHRVEIVCT